MTIPQQEHAPSVTLAQQALDVYDRRGEFAMLPFMMANMSPAEDSGANWQNRGYGLMDDGSDIVHQDGRYAFGWHDPETDKETTAERFSAMPDHGRPEPTKTDVTPVMKWPNRNDVWSTVMDLVEYRSDKQAEDSVITEPDVSYRIAPSLYHAISAAIDSAETSHYVAKHVDNIARNVADEAVKLVQPDELQALVDHATNTEVELANTTTD